MILHQLNVNEKDVFQCKAGSCSSASGHAEDYYSAIKVTLGESSHPCGECMKEREREGYLNRGGSRNIEGRGHIVCRAV